jgi:hypothetical protein
LGRVYRFERRFVGWLRMYLAASKDPRGRGRSRSTLLLGVGAGLALVVAGLWVASTWWAADLSIGRVSLNVGGGSISGSLCDDATADALSFGVTPYNQPAEWWWSWSDETWSFYASFSPPMLPLGSSPPSPVWAPIGVPATPVRIQELTIPLWMVWLLVLAPTLWLWWKGRVAPGSCMCCAYDLAGNTTGTCPECGKAAAL